MNKILLALILSATASHAFDTVEFLGASSPEDQGWTRQGTVTTQIVDDALKIDDQDPDSGAFFSRPVESWIAESARVEGFALEIEALIESQPGPGSHRVEFSFAPYRLVLVLRSENDQQMIQALTSGDQPFSATQKGTKFIVWKIVWTPKGDEPTFSLYCNDKLVKSDLKALAGNSNQLNFGALAEIQKERTGSVLYKRITLRPLKDGE